MKLQSAIKRLEKVADDGQVHKSNRRHSHGYSASVNGRTLRFFHAPDIDTVQCIHALLRYEGVPECDTVHFRTLNAAIEWAKS